MEKLRPNYNEELSILSSNLNIPIDELTEYLEKSINKHIGIDPNKVLSKLISMSVKIGSRNGREWLRTNIYILLGERQGEVSKDNSINIAPLYNKFREERFSGDEVDKYLIEEIALCILGQPHTTIQEIAKTYEAIVNYMLQKNERTYDRFIDYIMKSKLVKEKCHIDLMRLKDKVKTELEEIKDVINN